MFPSCWKLLRCPTWRGSQKLLHRQQLRSLSSAALRVHLHIPGVPKTLPSTHERRDICISQQGLCSGGPGLGPTICCWGSPSLTKSQTRGPRTGFSCSPTEAGASPDDSTEAAMGGRVLMASGSLSCYTHLDHPFSLRRWDQRMGCDITPVATLHCM